MTETTVAPGTQVLSRRAYAWTLLITSLVSFAAAFDLAIEGYALLKNPTHKAACDVNVFISCSSVMSQPEAALLGFPNTYLGIASFAVMITFAMGLFAGATYRPWFWWGLIAGQVAGLAMVVFLIYTSVFQLGTLCPWCVVTWCATIPAFIMTLAHATTSDALGLSPERRAAAGKFFAYWPLQIIGVFAVIIILIATKFM